MRAARGESSVCATATGEGCSERRSTDELCRVRYRHADPDGRLETASSLNASVSKGRGQSRSAFSPAKDDLTSEVASALRLKRVFSQNQGYWSDLEVTLGSAGDLAD